MMKWEGSDPEIWLGGEGVRFLQNLGVTAGEAVADFGCNAGHYTIPAAEVVDSTGRVYAIEQDTSALVQLKKQARSHKLKNIIYINTSAKQQIDIPPHSINLVLVYDVLHYFEAAGRKNLYIQFHSWLKPGECCPFSPSTINRTGQCGI